MQYGIAFTPLVPSLVLWLALAAIAVIAALLLLGRVARRGGARRGAGADRCWRSPIRPLPARIASRCRRSPRSWSTRARARISATAPAKPTQAREALVDSLKKIKGLEVRVVEAGQADGETDGTQVVRRAVLGAVGRSGRSRRRRLPDHRRPGARHSRQRRGARVPGPGACADHRPQGRARPPHRDYRPRRASASSARPRPSPTGSTTRASAASAPRSWCAATAR